MRKLGKKSESKKSRSHLRALEQDTKAEALPSGHQDLQFAEEIYPEVLLESLRSIISTLEEKDSYTHGHSLRVAEYAVIIAHELNLSDLEVREVELCALFHDIGKGYPDKDHSDYGEELIRPLVQRMGFDIEDVETIALLVKHHLLLPSVATRRDLDDPHTLSAVIDPA